MIEFDRAGLPAPLQAPLESAWRNLHADLGDAASTLDARLRDDAIFHSRFVQLLCCSQFAAQTLSREPELLVAMLDDADFGRSREEGEIRTLLREMLTPDANEAELTKALRRLRRREMLRIVWRDLNRLADLEETTRDLSLLAEACLDVAIERIHAELVARHGEPRGANDGQAQRMVVLGMGKLGARELNLSSDIDLIFAYPESGETDGDRALSNHEFFTRLGQRLIKAIDSTTADGFVFRVDMRLRPYGDSGALALNFDAMEEYYQEQGRDWERYAMIKARTVAGDRAGGERLLEMLRPFVYRRYIDFGAIEALRRMKDMIQREVARRGKNDDVKLGSGGIREIEFIAQSFQLIRGGRETALQERRLLRVLDLLGEMDQLPQAVVGELKAAYVFLRNTEHALQAWADRQTQALPRDEEGRARLAMAMGFADWDTFSAALEGHRQRVAAHFADVVAPPREEKEESAAPALWRSVWALEVDPLMLGAFGFDEPEETIALLRTLRESQRLQMLQPAGRERLDSCMPLLLEAAACVERPSTAVARLMPLVEAVLRRSAYLVLLEENPVAMQQLVRLCSASPWIAHELANHPLLLDELIDHRTLYTLPDRDRLRDELRQSMMRIAPDDLEAQMDGLRHFKLAHDLRCAASEVTGALPLMKVSDYLSWQAEAILAHALNICWQHLVAKHGRPQKEPGVPCDPDFIIVGFGKLGGIELGHGSDLDLVFIHDADPALGTDGERELDNSVFFTRLGQRIIHMLTAFTSLGTLYEVDMRLRPSGEAGLLVSSLRAFEQYEERQAWTWEHQALVRARPVAGSPELAVQFDELRRRILARERDLQQLQREVLEMRAKMRGHLLKPETSGGNSRRFHLKQSVGGIVDIEFMVQYCVLAWSAQHPALSVYTDNIRILEALSASGLIPTEDAELLTGAYKAYRTAVHRLTLQKQDEIVDAEEFQAMRDGVSRIWRTLLGEENEAA